MVADVTGKTASKYTEAPDVDETDAVDIRLVR
jgi:hypothetical protein